MKPKKFHAQYCLTANNCTVFLKSKVNIIVSVTYFIFLGYMYEFFVYYVCNIDVLLYICNAF